MFGKAFALPPQCRDAADATSRLKAFKGFGGAIWEHRINHLYIGWHLQYAHVNEGKPAILSTYPLSA